MRSFPCQPNQWSQQFGGTLLQLEYSAEASSIFPQHEEADEFST